MTATPTTKYCPMCNTTKPTAEFHKHIGTKDGLQCYCAPCQIAQTRDYAIIRQAKARIEGRQDKAARSRTRMAAKAALALQAAPAPKAIGPAPVAPVEMSREDQRLIDWLESELAALKNGRAS